MKRNLAFAAITMVASVLSCQTDEPTAVFQEEGSQEVLEKISNMGFSTENIKVLDDAYLVEGDILIHDADLQGISEQQSLRIAEEEQYRTFNLVKNLPRTIKVRVSGTVSSAFSNAVNAALARYNAEPIGLTFKRVTSGGDIIIRQVTSDQYIASAGFPQSNGTPYPEIRYARKFNSYSAGFMTTVIAHEIGHCIGFRHTDYMKRSYSCGSGGNEGERTSGVGAVHIPGTPTSPDNLSWMLACMSSNTNRPFNSNDKKALNYLY